MKNWTECKKFLATFVICGCFIIFSSVLFFGLNVKADESYNIDVPINTTDSDFNFNLLISNLDEAIPELSLSGASYSLWFNTFEYGRFGNSINFFLLVPKDNLGFGWDPSPYFYIDNYGFFRSDDYAAIFCNSNNYYIINFTTTEGNLYGIREYYIRDDFFRKIDDLSVSAIEAGLGNFVFSTGSPVFSNYDIIDQSGRVVFNHTHESIIDPEDPTDPGYQIPFDPNFGNFGHAQDFAADYLDPTNNNTNLNPSDLLNQMQQSQVSTDLPLYTQLLNDIKNRISALNNNLYSWLAGINSTIANDFQAFYSNFAAAINNIISQFGNLFNQISSFFTSVKVFFDSLVALGSSSGSFRLDDFLYKLIFPDSFEDLTSVIVNHYAAENNSISYVINTIVPQITDLFSHTTDNVPVLVFPAFTIASKQIPRTEVSLLFLEDYIGIIRLFIAAWCYLNFTVYFIRAVPSILSGAGLISEGSVKNADN